MSALSNGTGERAASTATPSLTNNATGDSNASFIRSYRTSFWSARGSQPRRREQAQLQSLAATLRLRPASHRRHRISDESKELHAQLRVPPKRNRKGAASRPRRDIRWRSSSPLPHLGQYAPKMHEPAQPIMGQLRWEGHSDCLGVGHICRLCSVGRIGWVRGPSNHRADRQRWRLPALQLPMGNDERAGTKSQIGGQGCHWSVQRK